MELTDVFLDELLPTQLKGAKVELKAYLGDSYGSNSRLDYGSGHEMAFAFFLLALYRLGFFVVEDFESCVRNVFYEYIKLMRKN
jgi:serine/threonine-protein phosphatase 2A activator